MHAAKCRTKFVAFDNKNGANITFVTFFTSKTYLSSARLPMGVALIAYVTCKVRHGRGLIKNLSMKLDFSQTRPSRSGFHSEHEAFAQS